MFHSITTTQTFVLQSNLISISLPVQSQNLHFIGECSMYLDVISVACQKYRRYNPCACDLFSRHLEQAVLLGILQKVHGFLVDRYYY
jgi:hypothetical protein